MTSNKVSEQGSGLLRHFSWFTSVEYSKGQ